MHYVYSEIGKSYKSDITILSNLFLHLNPRCMQMKMYLKLEIGIDLVYNRCIEKICAENTRNIRVYKMFISRIQAYKQSNKSIEIVGAISPHLLIEGYFLKVQFLIANLKMFHRIILWNLCLNKIVSF